MKINSKGFRDENGNPITIPGESVKYDQAQAGHLAQFGQDGKIEDGGAKDQFASDDHTHEEYAAVNHNHDNDYAAKDHTHPEIKDNNGSEVQAKNNKILFAVTKDQQYVEAEVDENNIDNLKKLLAGEMMDKLPVVELENVGGGYKLHAHVADVQKTIGRSQLVIVKCAIDTSADVTTNFQAIGSLGVFDKDRDEYELELCIAEHMFGLVFHARGDQDAANELDGMFDDYDNGQFVAKKNITLFP